MNRFDRISDFLKNAPKRLADARELMDSPTVNPSQSDAQIRHLRAAMYLAGYGVECMLKAYICDQEECQSLAAAMHKINGQRASKGLPAIRDIATTSAGHSVGYMVGLTDLVERNGYDRALWGRLAKWNSGWRYDHTHVARATAEEFISDVATALNWLRPAIISQC